MKRTAAVLFGLILILCLAWCSAETAVQQDRQILFEQTLMIVGNKLDISNKPQVVRMTEDAPENTKLVWHSSNPAVATVNSWGRVTTLTPGGTLITALAADNPEIRGSYELYVVWPVEELIPVEPEITLTLDPDGARDETDLFYIVRPSDAWMGGVKWSTSDPAVVTVDQTGHVQAVAPGNAAVTLEAVMPLGSTQKKKAMFRIHVNREAETLTLSEKKAALKRGEIVQLKAKVEPEDATGVKLVWTSSDPAVAKVTEGGRIKAVGSGECEVRCASADGRMSDACSVTVTWPTQDVELSRPGLKLSPGEQYQLEAAVHPFDADDTGVIWSSSNAQIASVDDTGLVTAELGGDCVITCVPADGIGQGAQCGIHVLSFSVAQKEWIVDQPAGITIPIQWHSFDPIALELKPGSVSFRATWDANNNIRIEPLSVGAGTLMIQSAENWEDRIELKIQVTGNAVTNPDDYPRMTYDGLLQNEPETGTKGKILGKVLQRLEQPDQIILLVGTAGEDWSREVFWVEHGPGDPVAKTAEGDLVVVCGSYQGVYTYEGASGEEVSVPALKARQITVR
jgi:uncharacterized protein YjdB